MCQVSRPVLMFAELTLTLAPSWGLADSVLAATPTMEEPTSDYIGPANALVAEHGGDSLPRTASHEQLQGEAQGPAILK